MEIAFVQAPRQNHFFLELVGALRDELEGMGARTSLHWATFPPPRDDLVYALIPPHEYFTLMHGRVGPDDDVLKRTIFICAEQPGSSWFEWNAELAPRAGALFDINPLAVREYRDLGLAAEHLQLGWTSRWDHLANDRERDIDVLFMGCASKRRLEYLSQYASTLWHRNCHYLLSDNSRPNWAASGTYVADDGKWDLLNRSKILINLHQDEIPYFEWLRIVQAMANGCVVVSEHSLDYAPLEPGTHFLAGRPESLGLLADLLLDDGHRRWEMQRAAHGFLRAELTLGPSVVRLAEAAGRLTSHPVPDARNGFFLQAPPTEAETAARVERLRPPEIMPEDDDVRRALKDLKLDLVDMRRRFDRMTLERRGDAVPTLVADRRSRGYAAARPAISVLVTVYNYADHIGGALDSIARSTRPDWELIIVDDASSDGSADVVRGWIADHEHTAAILLRHPVNRGLARSRNAALAFARGRASFVLDADNEVYPNCLELLAAALEEEPDAAFAYGLLERFGAEGSLGLVDIYPWEPERLRAGNYIDAMTLIRTERLRAYGGYRTDRRLHGWEDFDLWCRMAEAGDRAVQLKRVVARYRMTGHSMLSLTNVSVADALSVIVEASPSVMSGVLD